MGNLLPQSPARKPAPPRALGFIAHPDFAAAIRADLQAILPTCAPALSTVEAWQTTGTGILILLVTLDGSTPIKAYLADKRGRGAFVRQLSRAIHSLHGAKSAWFLRLHPRTHALAETIMRSVAERVTLARRLEDAEPLGVA